MELLSTQKSSGSMDAPSIALDGVVFSKGAGIESWPFPGLTFSAEAAGGGHSFWPTLPVVSFPKLKSTKNSDPCHHHLLVRLLQFILLGHALEYYKKLQLPIF